MLGKSVIVGLQCSVIHRNPNVVVNTSRHFGVK